MHKKAQGGHMSDMRCLGCGMREWHIAWTKCEAEVEGITVSFSMNLFRCNGCGQTSATPEVMEEFIGKCLGGVRREHKKRVESEQQAL